MVAVKVAIRFSTNICILSSETLSRILIVYLARNDRPPSIWQHVISRLTRMSSISAVSKIEGFTESNAWKIFSRMFYSYVQAKYVLDISLSRAYIYQNSSCTHQLDKREIFVINNLWSIWTAFFLKILKYSESHHSNFNTYLKRIYTYQQSKYKSCTKEMRMKIIWKNKYCKRWNRTLFICFSKNY